ncbi:coiled-coil domain-containing protein 185 [Sorex araneus]|uniref:coiled-coil domain-containing protein 185 n=1 Tax=Sorex araneus TaxID=42254 RepID=UPI002433EB54|nr:coiled-coil domain-containing protein 185 [Sorex araneus]
MDGFGRLSPPPACRELREPPRRRLRSSSARPSAPGAPLEPALSSWTRTRADESEAAAPWAARRRSPATPRPRRRRRYLDSPRESRSLTDLSRRPPAERARKHRAGSRRLEEAWGEARIKPPRPVQDNLHCPHYRQGPEESPSPSPDPAGSYTSLMDDLGAGKTPDGDQWAVHVCRGLGRWSLTSILTDKSSALSHECGIHSACVYPPKKDGADPVGSVGSQYSQHSFSSKDTQILKNQLEEAIVSSRDEKIVALVLSRLKKAQRMRELQRQAAVAWEELKASDHQVQRTLEKERRLLLQQSQEQWKHEKEPRRARLKREPRVRRQGSSKKNRLQPEEPWTSQLENQHQEKLERLQRNRIQAEHRKLCQEQRLQEHERMLQGVREHSHLQLQRRLERASHKKHLYTLEGQKKVQEANLSSLVNYQARKVLMDCQAKAEEVLRKLSLEQSCQRSQDLQRGLLKERQRELREKVQKEEEQFQQVKSRAEEFEELKKVHKQLLVELANQKIHRARSTVHRNIQDKAQHIRELNILREKNHHILKLKAEKEEKCHIEGIKEAIRKKEQKMEQISRQKEAAFEQLRKSGRTLRRDLGIPTRSCSSLNPLVQETQLCACQQGDY